MAITFAPLTATFGATVHGVNIAAGVSEADFPELIRLFNEYSVLVFPDQDITDAQQIRFSKGFGPLESTVRTNAGTGQETPPVPQAVVRVNPMPGQKNFYAGAHASYIRGMPVEEGRKLLQELTAFATQPQYVYVHQWHQYDVVMWDNRCYLHRGRPWDKARYRRVMHRTTVAGVEPTAE